LVAAGEGEFLNGGSETMKSMLSLVLLVVAIAVLALWGCSFGKTRWRMAHPTDDELRAVEPAVNDRHNWVDPVSEF
jgi:hypothetical protein